MVWTQKATMVFVALSFVGCGGTGPLDGDLTCVGDRAAPKPGELETVTYEIRNPTDEVTFPNAVVHIFPDGIITSDCGDNCQELLADSDGRVEVTLPSGWFAYRVIGGEQAEGVRLTTIETNAVHPPDDAGFLNALWQDSMEAIFTFAGATDPALGKAVVRGVDCTETPLTNLRPRVFSLDGAELTPVVAYFNEAEDFPAIGRAGTNLDGRAFLGNLPPGDVRVELWGHRGDGVDERVSCEVLPIEAGGATTSRVRPLGTDASPACASSDPGMDVQ